MYSIAYILIIKGFIGYIVGECDGFLCKSFVCFEVFSEFVEIASDLLCNSGSWEEGDGCELVISKHGRHRKLFLHLPDKKSTCFQINLFLNNNYQNYLFINSHQKHNVVWNSVIVLTMLSKNHEN